MEIRVFECVVLNVESQKYWAIEMNGVIRLTKVLLIVVIGASVAVNHLRGPVAPVQTFSSLADLSPEERDEAELIRLTLERALVAKEIPDYELIRDKENIVLSTENIDLRLVPTIPGVNLILLTPEQIQRKADREGDFLYLRFRELNIQNPENAVVKLDNFWAGRNSPHMYLSGGFAIFYSKASGEWRGKVAYMWIS